MFLLLRSILYRPVGYEMFVLCTTLMHVGEVASAHWRQHVSISKEQYRSRRKLIPCCEKRPDLLGRILSTVLGL